MREYIQTFRPAEYPECETIRIHIQPLIEVLKSYDPEKWEQTSENRVRLDRVRAQVAAEEQIAMPVLIFDAESRQLDIGDGRRRLWALDEAKYEIVCVLIRSGSAESVLGQIGA